MGGLTFFLFLVETITGLLLMFYYRPTADGGVPGHHRHPRARADRRDARDAPLGGAHDGDHRVAAHVPRSS
jgi:quinol-cytochrome oxidoreductase complex cytochrome b subunit